VIFVKEVHGQSGYSYEGAWVPVSNNSIAYFNEMRVADSGTDWQIENDFRSLYINYSSDGQIQPYDSGATTTTIPLRFDCTSEIDLAPENRVSGGYLQTRCKKVMLAVSGTTPPKLYLKASSNYGAWANGAIVSGCA
jgi:hypothetical protein